MSSIVLQIGQCGNQVGSEFWKLVLKENGSSMSHVYQHVDGCYRSINVDSEPKVVSKVVKQSQSQFRDSNVLLGKRGRGTNWALGYHGFKSSVEDNMLADIVEATRREAEKLNSFSGVITMHSVSGGTGAGLGSHLTEVLRDEFPMHYLLSCVVAPFAGGESPLQHYNALLTLAWLQRYSDGILLINNDEVLQRLQKKAGPKKADVGISFAAMNTHIAECLAGVFLPVDTITPSSGTSIGLEPWEMLRSTCPMPDTKFLHITQASRSKLNWEGITTQLTHSLNRYDSAGNSYASLSNLAVARGDATQMFHASSPKIEKLLKQAYNCVSWNPYPLDFWVGKSNPAGQKDTSSLTVVSNYSSVADHLSHTVSMATNKYQAGAFLHWYWKHGCEEMDFTQAFDTLNNVITNYKEAVK